MGNRRLKEWGKNLLIAGLTLSAVFLLTRTQLYTTGVETGLFSGFNGLFGGTPSATDDPKPEDGWGQGTAMRPARIALLDATGCHSIQYNSDQVSTVFADLVNPLVDALASASAPQSIGVYTWQQALSGGDTGVYLDFLGDIPLQNLYLWLSGGTLPPAHLTHTARRLLLSIDGNGSAWLYYQNTADGHYYRCGTSADLAQRLTDVTTGYSPNATFAFQSPQQYADLDDNTLIGVLAPQPLIYTATNPMAQTTWGDAFLSENAALDQLVRALDFHPESFTAYPVTDGVTIREGGDTLTITQAGFVSYRAALDEAPRHPIATAHGGETPPWNQLDGAWAFAEETLTRWQGDAQLYLTHTEQEDTTLVAYFGYQLDGAAVEVGATGYAARVEVTADQITAFDLQLRQYTATADTTLVLQEVRAMAALMALDVTDDELVLCYMDRLGTQVTAGWIAQ